MALLPEIRALLDQMDARGRPPLHRQAVAQARAFYVEDSPDLIGPAAAVASVAGRVVPGPAGELPVRVYTPEGEPPFPIVVWFHGGGWVVGTLDTYDPLCRALAAAVPAVVVSVDYRLAPEHPIRPPSRTPMRPPRGRRATRPRWAAPSTGWPSPATAPAGTWPRRSPSAPATGAGPQVAFQLLVYPVLDAAGDTGSWAEFAEGFYLTAAGMRWYWDHYLAGADGGAPDASPLRAAFVGGLPPALVIGAEHDILRDEGEAYAARLREAGVDATATRYPGVVHGFFRWRAVTAAADTALQEAATALRSALAPPGA